MPAHLSHDPQCENVHFVGSYFLEHLGILKYDGTVAGGGGRGRLLCPIVWSPAPLRSDPCSSDVSQHGKGTRDLAFVTDHH